jgi:glycerol-1-phosphate dehydrogenase [NAD(P)+]
MSDYTGILNDLVAGTWEEPGTGKRYNIPINDIVIQSSLDGAEAELVAKQHARQSLTIVSDQYTHAALGSRIFKALKSAGFDVHEYVWDKPSCSEQGVEVIRHATRHTDGLIAVGSGSINDTVKYASFLDKRPYSVFATSPMNAFTTSTASVSFGGFKKSITCHGASGVYFDLSVLSQCPPRLISAAFADVICRTTAQVDWLMSHLLFDTSYSETPYTLLALDEADMMANAGVMLTGDRDALGMLTRISAIMGLGTSFTATTHSGSMAEHMISHYIDMFAGDRHPGTSHGEQVGVGTVTMSQMHNQVLSGDSPPLMHATLIPEADLRARFSAEVAENLITQTRMKALDEASAEALNNRFASEWPTLSKRLRSVMLPFDQLRSAMQTAGCQLTATDLALPADFYREAVRSARYIRDRFSMLDLVDDSTGLDAFVADMLV